MSPDLSGRGAVFALNASTGSILRNFPTDNAVSSSARLQTVSLCCSGWQVYAFDAQQEHRYGASPPTMK